MAPVLFTVVVPAYNRAGMLRSALESVLWQTCRDYECFVLDNCSSDDTPKVFEEYAGRQGFHFKRFDANRGVQQSRNYAIGHSTGRYITFLDSDDLWLPDRLAEFKKLVTADPQAGFIFSNAYIFRYGRVCGKLFPEDKDIPEGRLPGYFAVGESKLPYLTTNLAVVRSAFEEFGLYRTDVRLLDDTELYARMLAGGVRVRSIRRALAVRTLHESQITHNYRQAFEDAVMSMKSGGADEETLRIYRQELGAEVALYMLKAAQPGQALRFLEEAGIRGPASERVRLLARVPAPVLRLGRWVRAAALKLRYSRMLQPREFSRVQNLISPLMGPHT